MCGIAGIIRVNDKFEVTAEMIKKVLSELQSRGTDATGISWRDDEDNVLVLKAPCKATDFITLPEFIENLPKIIKSHQILMHTRWATQGSPAMNYNNHPIWNDKGLIIHNGVVHSTKNLKATGLTDTEQILLSIQEFGWREGLKNVHGSLSIAYQSFEDGDIYFYSESSPFVYARNDNVFIFASTETIGTLGFDVPRAAFKDLKKQVVFRLVKNRWLMPIMKIKRSFINNANDWIGKLYGKSTGTADNAGCSPAVGNQSTSIVKSDPVTSPPSDVLDWIDNTKNPDDNQEIQSESDAGVNSINEGP